MEPTNPFRFRGPASDEFVAGREKEKKQLLGILKNSQSAVLYAPRRFGKTWLLGLVAKAAKEEGVVPIYLDLFPISSVPHLLECYATAIVRAFAKTREETQKFCEDNLSFMGPQIGLSKEEWIMTYNWEHTESALKRISPRLFVLPEQIARKEHLKSAVIFDEFQEINRFNGERWEREMRAIFQQQENVAYIFSGSKTHMIVNMFTDVRRPFYQSAAMVSLSEISDKSWKVFIAEKLNNSKINFSSDVLEQILFLTRGHPYYTQLLCYFTWGNCSEKGRITVKDVIQSLTESLENEDAYFRQLWDDLPLTQRRLLMAIAREGGAHIFSGDFMVANSLGPASSIRLAALALTRQKGLLDRVKDEYRFTEPFFRLWVRREVIGLGV